MVLRHSVHRPAIRRACPPPTRLRLGHDPAAASRLRHAAHGPHPAVGWIRPTPALKPLAASRSSSVCMPASRRIGFRARVRFTSCANKPRPAAPRRPPAIRGEVAATLVSASVEVSTCSPKLACGCSGERVGHFHATRSSLVCVIPGHALGPDDRVGGLLAAAPASAGAAPHRRQARTPALHASA